MDAPASASRLRLLVLLTLVAWPTSALAQLPADGPLDPPATSKLIQFLNITPLVAFAGADMRVVVRVLPDAENRRLQLSVDAPTFYASTERQLDGLLGARAHTFTLHELPAGEYQITAVLEGPGGVRTRLTRSFRVMGESQDGQPLEESPTPGRRRRR